MKVAVLASPDRNRSLAFGGTFVLLAVLAGCVAFIPHMGIVALAACSLGAFFGYMGLRSDPQGGDLFEIIVPLSILSVFYFGVGTMYLVLVPQDLDYPALAPFLLPAQALATLGFFSLLMGYAWFFRKTAPSPLGRLVPNSIIIYFAPFLMGALGMSVHRFQLRGLLNQGGISSSLSVLQQFGPLLYFGWFLAWYMWWAGRLRASVAGPMLLAMSAISAVVLYFTFGSKTLAVTLLGIPAVAYYEVRRKLPKKSILVVVLIFLFVIFPMYNTFRQVDKSLDTTRRVDRAVDMARTWDSNQYLDASVFAFLKRMSIVTSVAAIVSDTGRWVNYRYGDTLILAPIGLLIPRFLWPEKPSIGIGREFGATFRLTNPLDYETEVAPSMVGDFYWNFSVPGVILGMWLMGMGYRWIYQRYGAGAGFDPIRKSIYFTILPIALLVEGNVAMVVGGVVKALAIIVIFLVLSSRLGWLEGSSAD